MYDVNVRYIQYIVRILWYSMVKIRTLCRKILIPTLIYRLTPRTNTSTLASFRVRRGLLGLERSRPS
jgi:hypothetical protein